MNTLLSAKDLRKTYGSGQSSVTALDGVSLDVLRGELLAILGSSGSGKSTLLNMLGGMDRPDSGSIRFQGREIGTLGDRGLRLTLGAPSSTQSKPGLVRTASDLPFPAPTPSVRPGPRAERYG